jgi:uncharacterized membrane protein
MHKQLEEYLNTLAVRLGKLPAAQREEELCEIRQHLELLVASHREQGRSEEEAIRLAISQFGRAEKIGHDLGQAGRKSDVAHSATASIIICSVCMLIAYSFFSLMNDKPTDFPYHQSDKLILAAVLTLTGFSLRRLLEKKKIKA